MKMHRLSHVLPALVVIFSLCAEYLCTADQNFKDFGQLNGDRDAAFDELVKTLKDVTKKSITIEESARQLLQEKEQWSHQLQTCLGNKALETNDLETRLEKQTEETQQAKESHNNCKTEKYNLKTDYDNLYEKYQQEQARPRAQLLYQAAKSCDTQISRERISLKQPEDVIFWAIVAATIIFSILVIGINKNKKQF